MGQKFCRDQKFRLTLGMKSICWSSTLKKVT